MLQRSGKTPNENVREQKHPRRILHRVFTRQSRDYKKRENGEGAEVTKRRSVLKEVSRWI